METIVLIALIFILLAMGVNIGVSLALPMLISILIEPSLSAGYIVSSLYTQTANFTMIAMPFFIVAGSVMEAAFPSASSPWRTALSAASPVVSVS